MRFKTLKTVISSNISVFKICIRAINILSVIIKVNYTVYLF